jgi:NSS family neurotransmitter:Na+ symporter
MPGGWLIGPVFFALLVAAALTSMVSLLEVPVAAIVHRTRLSRRTAVAVIGTAIFVVGIPSALSFGLLGDMRIFGRGVLDAIDQAVSNYLLPIGGILVCVYAGWHLPKAEALASSGLGSGRTGLIWLWLVRVLAPLTILVILRDTIGAV